MILITGTTQRIKAIFLDRDGTIGGDREIHYPGNFKLYSYTADLIDLLKKKNTKIFSFTNQPGISKGLAKISDFEEELREFGFDDVFLCPHSQEESCSCRKPSIGMLVEAAEKHNLNLHHCIVIGDRWSDMVAASKVGAIKILVLTGAGKEALEEHRHLWIDIDADYVAENLADAIQWVLDSGIL
jgi:histidinol-phosphate phosphatase family protein